MSVMPYQFEPMKKEYLHRLVNTIKIMIVMNGKIIEDVVMHAQSELEDIYVTRLESDLCLWCKCCCCKTLSVNQECLCCDRIRRYKV